MLVSACLAAPALAADWPQFRGPNRDGVSAETGLLRAWPEGGPKVLWTTPVGQGYAAAAIFDGKVYFNDYDETTSEYLIRCLSLADGKELWRFTEKRRIRPNHGITRTVPATDGTHVFSLDPKAVLHALDAATGKERVAQEPGPGLRVEDPALVQRPVPADREGPGGDRPGGHRRRWSWPWTRPPGRSCGRRPTPTAGSCRTPR